LIFCLPSSDQELTFADRKLFLASVLAELRGHELQVATDPDTAVVLERLLPSMGDWGRRVVGDAFGDSWEEMIRHRFGSHVAQTWFTLGAETLDREVSSSGLGAL
jgi:nucleolar protein 9